MLSQAGEPLRQSSDGLFASPRPLRPRRIRGKRDFGDPVTLCRALRQCHDRGHLPVARVAVGAGRSWPASALPIVLVPLTEQISVGIDFGCAGTIRGHAASSVMVRIASQAQILYFTRSRPGRRGNADADYRRRFPGRTFTFSAMIRSQEHYAAQACGCTGFNFVAPC
jgi:hypothetical protein